jgi:hypothetical protein
MFQLDSHTQIPYSKLNIFLKACFTAAKAATFDIRTLTVETLEVRLVIYGELRSNALTRSMHSKERVVEGRNLHKLLP